MTVPGDNGAISKGASQYDESDFDGLEVESSNDFAAVPDAFQRLWTPHRLVYITAGPQPHADECPFCVAPSLSDEKSLIVARGTTCYGLLYLFP